MITGPTEPSFFGRRMQHARPDEVVSRLARGIVEESLLGRLVKLLTVQGDSLLASARGMVPGGHQWGIDFGRNRWPPCPSAVASPAAAAGSGDAGTTVGAQVGRPANTGAAAPSAPVRLIRCVSACAVVVALSAHCRDVLVPRWPKITIATIRPHHGQRDRRRTDGRPDRAQPLARLRVLRGSRGAASARIGGVAAPWALVSAFQVFGHAAAITARRREMSGSANDVGAEGLQVPGDLFFEAVAG